MRTAIRDDTAPPSAQGIVFLVAPGGTGDRAGLGRLMTSLTRYWRESGEGPAFRVVDPYGPGVLAIGPFYFVRALAQILWNARRGRIRLLHVHMTAWGSALRKGLIVRLGKRLGLPVVLHLHGSGFDEFYDWLPSAGRRWLLRTLECADRVIVVGEYWRRVLIEQIGLPAAPLMVIPNAVSGPTEMPIRRGSPCRILYLGRLEAKKGFPELLTALADERLANLDWSLHAAGRGDVAAFRRQAEVLGLSTRIVLTGWLEEDQVHKLLAESDVFVLPSHHEGMSMALLEAMAFGLAIVATPAGANDEAVIDGVSGLLVPIGDSHALALALARVIEDVALRSSLQMGARRRFREDYDIATHSTRLIALYAELRRAAD
jgi:glycosyltransferase involved in cell wall biosynthesis